MKHIIFLLGLPRSGSTLLQRMLASHSSIHSVAEPWILLPLITCFDPKVNMSIYGHELLDSALNDLSKEYEGLKEDYKIHIRDFITKVYDELRHEKNYFLDKTPRYYLIASELKRIFPNSKFIYLFRNPVDIYDSVIETFCANKLFLLSYVFYDMSKGLDLLTMSINTNKNEPHIKYEELCINPESILKDISEYLEIVYEDSMLNDYMKTNFNGIFGDPKRHSHKTITAKNNGKKPLSFFRRKIYLKLIDGISEQALLISGYERRLLVKQILDRPKASPYVQLIDFFGYVTFKVINFFGSPFMLKKLGKSKSHLDSFLF